MGFGVLLDLIGLGILPLYYFGALMMADSNREAKIVLPDCVEVETTSTPEAAVIWLHGLGADGHDFEPVVSELGLPSSLGVRFLFPHAPIRPITLNGGMAMRGWYDIIDLEFGSNEDWEGVLDSVRLVEGLIESQIARGISAENIILAGFSQGGAVALYTGLNSTLPLAGIIALSTYLPLADRVAPNSGQALPLFMAHGEYDPLIPIGVGRNSAEKIRSLGFQVEWESYPIEHAVSLEEIRAIGRKIVQYLQ